MDNHEFCAHFAATLCPRRPAAMLDYGCGAARTVELLRQQGYDAYGCDVFYEGGSYRADLRREHIDRGIVRDMPGGVIPFADATFDLVLSNQVLEHVPDLGAALDDVARVLKPGGVFFSLFPDRSTWREGHVGIPFLHWFSKGSRARVWYAALLRGLGLGSHKGTKGVLQWSRDACEWLDAWTHYRSYAEVREMFDRRFDNFTHHEAAWLAARFPRRPWIARALPRRAQALVVRKGAGMVVTCRKAGR